MERKIVQIASILGMLAIILGAFGAHALKKVLTVEQLATFETGVKYQMYHALFLLFVGLSTQVSALAKKRIFYFILFGVLFFSGSIYLLATNDLTSFDFKVIGFVTPIGGLLLILGWLCLFVDFINKKS
jgi:uncharacterized membrane protein YgdD (TMEM256/DUF423 family)